ncbi:MAG: molybdate metabolism regulator [Pseudomonadota bacterium]
MSELLFVALEAHHGERDHHRRYEVAVCRDLLGDWVATVAYGRAGQRLRRLQFGAADQEATRRFVRERLRRRLSAPRRIGCAYETTELIAGEGVALGEWVPEGLVGQAQLTVAVGG